MGRLPVLIITLCILIPLVACTIAWRSAGPTTGAFVLFAAVLTTCSAAAPVLLGVWTRAARTKHHDSQTSHHVEIIRRPDAR